MIKISFQCFSIFVHPVHFSQAGLDNTSEEEAAAFRKQAKLVLGEEDFRKQGRSKEIMAESVVLDAKGKNKAADL